MTVNKQVKVCAVALAGAVLSVGISAAPASAVTNLYCNTTGATGVSTIENWSSGVTNLDLSLAVQDTKADGHHVRIRLLGKNEGGALITWPWRANYDGRGVTKSWSTTASYSDGLYDVGIQVARYEGEEQLNSCTDWLRSDQT
jgi:hypothetical protein